MPSKINADAYWEDPLSFKKLMQGEQVTLKSHSGIIVDFVIKEIQTEGLILVPLKSDLLRTQKSIVVSAAMDFGGRKLKKGDEILIKYKDFPPKRYFVEFNVNNKYLVLRDAAKGGSIFNMILNLFSRNI